jgi:hypothetical protein
MNVVIAAARSLAALLCCTCFQQPTAHPQLEPMAIPLLHSVQCALFSRATVECTMASQVLVGLVAMHDLRIFVPFRSHRVLQYVCAVHDLLVGCGMWERTCACDFMVPATRPKAALVAAWQAAVDALCTAVHSKGSRNAVSGASAASGLVSSANLAKPGPMGKGSSVRDISDSVHGSVPVVLQWTGAVHNSGRDAP